MVAEATSQTRAPGFAPPVGIHRRQAWLPPGLQGVESILSGIASRTRPIDSHRARLTAWYQQFVQRAQPFIGWQPLTTAELADDDTQSLSDIAESQERTSAKEPRIISKDLPPITRPVSVAQDQASARHPHRFPAEQQPAQEPLVVRRSISGPIHTAAKSMALSERPAGDLSGSDERRMEGVVQRAPPPAREETVEDPAVRARSPEERRLHARDERTATEDQRLGSPLSAPPQPNEEQSLVRPRLRLAILRPINIATATVQRRASGPPSSGSSFPTAETKDFRGSEFSLVDEQSAFQPPLGPKASSFERQEVLGGFPASMQAGVRRDGDSASADLLGLSLRRTSALSNDGAPESGALGSSRQAESRESPAISPVATPGVQIRLLKPDGLASATQPSGNSVVGSERSTIEIPKPQAPQPAAPPPLDINAVADKVYQALQRRHQLERERRGLY